VVSEVRGKESATVYPFKIQQKDIQMQELQDSIYEQISDRLLAKIASRGTAMKHIYHELFTTVNLEVKL
jgi:hypothetical protein